MRTCRSSNGNWSSRSRSPTIVNAAVVGLLLAALYDPVWTSAIKAPEDFALATGAFALLAFWRAPPWLVVLLTAAMGALIALW